MAFQSIFQSAGYQRENVKTIIQPDQRTKVSSKVVKVDEIGNHAVFLFQRILLRVVMSKFMEHLREKLKKCMIWFMIWLKSP